MDGRRYILLACFLSILLVSCQPAQAVDTPAEVVTLQRYMQAFAEKDEVAYTRLICPSWESEGLLAFDAYKGMQSRLGEITCRRVSGQQDEANVNCQGKILLSYGNENQEIDLSSRLYRLTWNGDVWQVCGFAPMSQ